MTVGLYEGGSLERAIATRRVEIRSAWNGYRCELTNGNYSGRATLAISGVIM